MTDETKIALRNYDWLARNRSDVRLDFGRDVVEYGDGGAELDRLCDPEFTTAGADDRYSSHGKFRSRIF